MEFPIKTEALVVEKAGADFVMAPIILGEMGPDEVLVEMKYSGICHTVSNSEPSFILGAAYVGFLSI